VKLAIVYPGEDFVEPPCVVAHPRECWWDARFHVAVRQVLGEQWLSFCFRSSRTEGWYEDAVAHRGVDETKLSARRGDGKNLSAGGGDAGLVWDLN
jgi:hypothetical protein